MNLFFGHLFQFANFITFDIFVICYYGADLLVLYYEIRLFTKWQRNTRRWSCSSLASDHGVDGDFCISLIVFVMNIRDQMLLLSNGESTLNWEKNQKT